MSTIDVPDTGNYYRQNNRLGVQEAVIKRARPGLAVPHRKVTTSCCGGNQGSGAGPPSASFDEGLEEVDEIECNGASCTVERETNETRVEIQISEDGQIQVISDKETTV